MTRRNWFILGAVLLFLMGGLWVAGSTRHNPIASGNIVASPVSSVESAVTAKGSIVPARYARLAFGTSGTVARVLVKEGDKVKAGDVLAHLDTGDLILQAQAVQDALDVSVATLAQAKTGGTPGEIAAAEANLRSAQAAYDRAQVGPTEADLAILIANVRKAKAAVEIAQAAYDRVGGATNPMIGMLPQSLQLQQALLDFQIAQANYELKIKVDTATLAAAEAAIHNAQVALDLRTNGARPAEIAVSEARVRQARTALAQAQAALAKASLTASFDGTVTSIALRQGEMITAGAPAVTIADLSQLRVETTDLDEWGAARVKLGQPVKVSLNAFASKILTGKVVNIASQSVTLSTGDTSYVVTIALDQQDPEVRWGMTAKVEFQKQ
ncbi:MAG: efflux RND transporter periplasmic adaptor subunit [Chloroflexi bacterium]|nr:efflux RND transporter periplasmic adaptor subunit [Chloroflexota bacterium]